MSLTKRTLHNLAWSLFWFFLTMLPVLSFILYNCIDGNTYRTFSEVVVNDFGFLATNNFFYTLLSGLFTNSGSAFFGIELDNAYLILFTYYLSLLIIKFIIFILDMLLHFFESLTDKYVGKGGVK